ncbi:conserved hypothetical protein [Gluconacetobacter diazotrophicus PA1 5]|uniref:Uncharacterized protein n=2 Tax=Gluconacetobacter diazotrophicus TaxID=33996 RepID=A0A7W4NG45_GLUDI|nr:hypothetical protein [Gluconacetobacter diazotrophicus]ACI51951.1 conserved hypothetical protein [Gluconacetobacter diazotrophicus PA1 5]MBB2157122.1 hypothetical protein [Gluconacetobacter diazotrophicus]TWB05144.1 hypothetical protein FBZ86_11833 [Gluconacetobacter diazotrophicus]
MTNYILAFTIASMFYLIWIFTFTIRPSATICAHREVVSATLIPAFVFIIAGIIVLRSEWYFVLVAYVFVLFGLYMWHYRTRYRAMNKHLETYQEEKSRVIMSVFKHKGDPATMWAKLGPDPSKDPGWKKSYIETLGMMNAISASVAFVAIASILLTYITMS